MPSDRRSVVARGALWILMAGYHGVPWFADLVAGLDLAAEHHRLAGKILVARHLLKLGVN
jgi:hypothetical protein